MNRPVNILTIAIKNEFGPEVYQALEAYCDDSLDMIVLPELWLGDDAPPEPLHGETICRMGEIARRYRSYLLCPLYLRDEKRGRVNAAVLLGRGGEVEFVYEKVFPYWEELALSSACEPGSKAGIYETDFGKIGVAICFDVNFPALWKNMAIAGAEIVFWPSDYSGGAPLLAHAINHNYYVVSATRERDCSLADITGREIYYNVSRSITTSRITLDLDRELFHENYNMEKIKKLLDEHREIIMEQHLLREQWIVLSSSSPTVSVKTLAKQMGIEPLRSYKLRSEREINPDYKWAKIKGKIN